jgi:hypothetical protein
MGRVRRDAQYWSERVDKWLASGLSAREFAEREGVGRERLFYWKARLRPGTPPSAAGKIGFTPVTVVDAPRTESLGALEVVTGSGHTVRVATGFDEAALRRLLSVLGGA